MSRSDAAVQEPDTDLYSQLVAGDPGALEQIYDRYGALAYGLALRIARDEGRAEEIVQDVFTTLWRRAGTFAPDRGSFRTWFMTMVRNRAIDSLRGRGRRERGEVELPFDLRDTAAASDPWRALSLSLEQTSVRAALEALPSTQREAVELAFFGGYTHSEIAERLELPLGTVKGRLRLGLEKLHVSLTTRGFA